VPPIAFVPNDNRAGFMKDLARAEYQTSLQAAAWFEKESSDE